MYKGREVSVLRSGARDVGRYRGGKKEMTGWRINNQDV